MVRSTLILLFAISMVSAALSGALAASGSDPLSEATRDFLVVARPSAADPTKPPARRAVIVGVGRYQEERIPALAYSCADARALARVLADPERGGFGAENVVLMTDDATDAELKPTRLSVLAKLRRAADEAGPKDTLLFFFSGHGIAENGKGYLLPADAKVRLLGDTAIPTERVNEILAHSKAQNTVVVLDSCHSAAGKDAAGMSPEFARTLFSDADGRVTMASCQENQQSFEWSQMGHGVYTYYVVQGLGGQADDNRDGVVTVTELSTYVHDQVVRWATEHNHQQRPRARMNISGDIVLARAGTAPATVPQVLPARLRVESEPAGARVLVAAKGQPPSHKGVTPCDVIVMGVSGKPAEYQVTLEKNGYLPESLVMDLAGGEVVPLEIVLGKVEEADTAPPTVATTGSTTSFPAGKPGSRPTIRPGMFPGKTPMRPGMKRPLSPGAILLALHRIHRSGRPETEFTDGQRAQISRVLAPALAHKGTIPEEKARMLMARILPILRPEQRKALFALLAQGPALGARPVSPGAKPAPAQPKPRFPRPNQKAPRRW
ncbi:MAG: caspase family protein [Armatimonadetes bacterium]|nr:caspase family protein [Armatimonadota bacterium]